MAVSAEISSRNIAKYRTASDLRGIVDDSQRLARMALRKLGGTKVNVSYMQRVPNEPMGTWLAVFDQNGDNRRLDFPAPESGLTSDTSLKRRAMKFSRNELRRDPEVDMDKDIVAKKRSFSSVKKYEKSSMELSAI